MSELELWSTSYGLPNQHGILRSKEQETYRECLTEFGTVSLAQEFTGMLCQTKKAGTRSAKALDNIWKGTITIVSHASPRDHLIWGYWIHLTATLGWGLWVESIERDLLLAQGKVPQTVIVPPSPWAIKITSPGFNTMKHSEVWNQPHMDFSMCTESEYCCGFQYLQ